MTKKPFIFFTSFCCKRRLSIDFFKSGEGHFDVAFCNLVFVHENRKNMWTGDLLAKVRELPHYIPTATC